MAQVEYIIRIIVANSHKNAQIVVSCFLQFQNSISKSGSTIWKLFMAKFIGTVTEKPLVHESDASLLCPKLSFSLVSAQGTQPYCCQLVRTHAKHAFCSMLPLRQLNLLINTMAYHPLIKNYLEEHPFEPGLQYQAYVVSNINTYIRSKLSKNFITL